MYLIISLYIPESGIAGSMGMIVFKVFSKYCEIGQFGGSD